MFVPNRELGDFLLDARLLSRAELENFISHTGEESLYNSLYRSGAVPEDELRRAAARILGVPFGPVEHDDIVRETLMLIPEPLAREEAALAYRREGDALHVMLLDLSSLPSIAFLEREQGYKIIPRLTDRASIKRALIVYQRALKDSFASRFTSSDSETILDALLSHALLSRAEEIHLDPSENKTSVRYRINAVLTNAMALGAEARLVVAKLKELAHFSFTLNAPQEGRFKVALTNGQVLRVRVASLPTAKGEKITLHIHKEHSVKKGFTLSSLGFHGESVEKLHEMLLNREGLLLVCGPEGAGKSTLIYTLLDYLSTPETSIIAVEEKIEMDLPYATQTLVRRDLGQTTSSSVRAALTHHPDVLMVGEIADEDTAALAASAAARGIFVIAGIKADSAAEGMQQMLRYNVDPLVLSAVLRGSIGTRVVKKICPSCREEYNLSRVEAAPIEKFADFGRVLAALKAESIVEEGKQWKELLFSRAMGCGKCEGGYQGAIGLQEILPVSAITKELISSRASREDIEKRREVPLNIIEDGLCKAAQGLTSLEEVRKLLPPG
jgi:type IV pilus assembly protein PilB